jgi:hypothetical protein
MPAQWTRRLVSPLFDQQAGSVARMTSEESLRIVLKKSVVFASGYYRAELRHPNVLLMATLRANMCC